MDLTFEPQARKKSIESAKRAYRAATEALRKAGEMIRGILEDEHLDQITNAVFACMTKDGDIMSTGIGSRVVGLGLTEVLCDSLLQQIAGELGDDEEEEEEDV